MNRESIEKEALLLDKDLAVRALDELFVRSKSYRSSENYFELLNFISKFPSLSPFNAFLIHTQNAGVQIVQTAKKWKKYQRTVIPLARPLVILIPFGPVSFVYDVVDTEGRPLPRELADPFFTQGPFSFKVLERTLANCDRDQISIRMHELVRAVAGYAERKQDAFHVTIRKTLPAAQHYATLVHELGHIFAGHLGTTQRHWWNDRSKTSPSVKEIEAESISYLVSVRGGLTTSSAEYLSNYVRENDEVPQFSLETVLTVSGYIEMMGKRILSKRQPSEAKRRFSYEKVYKR